MVKVRIGYGSDIKNKTWVLFINEKGISIVEVESFINIKVGKHGSCKTICKARNVKNGKSTEFTITTNSVFIIEKTEEYLLPIYEINGDFSQFVHDYEAESSLVLDHFTRDSVAMFEYFKDQNKNLSEYQLANKYDNQKMVLTFVCMDYTAEDGKCYKWINEIGYLPSADLENNNKTSMIEKCSSNFMASIRNK